MPLKNGAIQESNPTSDKSSENTTTVVMPEIGFVIVSIGIATIAIASGYGSPHMPLKILSLVTYLLAIWGAFIFYWHILFEKIPKTMEKCVKTSKRLVSIKSVLNVFVYWIRLVFLPVIGKGKIHEDNSLESAYLTIFLALFMFWCSGIFLYVMGFTNLIEPH